MRNKHLRFLLVADRGQTLVTAALALPVLLGFAGLAIDMGALRYERRLQQTAADAAAIAGANELQREASGLLGSPTPAAQNASAQNGFAYGSTQVSDCGQSAAVGTVCVQVNSPPTSGPHAGQIDPRTGQSDYVEVLVAAVHPTFFMKIFGVTKSTVTARAVATLVSQQSNTKPGCVYTLDPPQANGGGGITVGGSTIVNAPNCGFSDNGNFTDSNNAAMSAGPSGWSGASRAGPHATARLPTAPRRRPRSRTRCPTSLPPLAAPNWVRCMSTAPKWSALPPAPTA